MKGITHFAIGLAAASCFPGAVRAGSAGDPLYFILAGICGVLPDTLDFKFTKFFYKSDILVIPDPLRPDAQQIADAVSLAVSRALATGRPVNLKLSTIQLAADQWQRYLVAFDVPNRAVHVQYGPVVDTGGNPLPHLAPASIPAGRATLEAGLELEYLATTTIDIFDGPVFCFEPTPAGRVRPVFIPWHRSWTHSVVVALLLALCGALAWDLLAGAVIFAAYAAHVLADQAGYLGSNLFAPLTRRRAPGLKLTHAAWPLPNFVAVWLALLLIFWNLARATTEGIGHLNPVRYLFLAAGLPVATFMVLQKPPKDES
ncbi:MAG: metal-dependent hydrolase [Lentisphaerae bacterium]|nr:metal-dependent hydrolase [Lentisphaerota bacterium]